MIDAGNGILLKAKTPFPEATLDQVASCLKYTGQAKSLDDMQEAIRKGAMEQFKKSRALFKNHESFITDTVIFET